MESEATWETLLLRNCEVWVYGEFMYAAQSPERERARHQHRERERERDRKAVAFKIDSQLSDLI